MTISVSLVCWLLFAHWVGDFVYQSDAMARGKSSSNKWLSYHVAVYTLVLILLTFNISFALINGAIHWCVDYVTSRRNTRLWNNKQVHDFFVNVGFDQFIHVCTLVLTAVWLL